MYRILLALLLVSLAYAGVGPFSGPPALQMGCGSNEVPSNILAESANVAAAERAELAIRRRSPGGQSRRTLKVDTYFHVIAENTTIEGGWVPESMLNAQMDVLNKRYEPADIQFDLKTIDYTINHDLSYFDNRTSTVYPDLATKKTLRKGDYKALNVYIVYKFASSIIAGQSTFPNKTEEGSDQFWNDGVKILESTLVGMPLAYQYQTHNTSSGTILVHEVGHWFGLLHTFGITFFDCDGPGDYVDDTPQEALPSLCQLAGLFPANDSFYDTCPDKPGISNTGNYMNYSEDWCLTYFTKGQIQRIWSWWKMYRGGNDGDYWYLPVATPSPSPNATSA